MRPSKLSHRENISSITLDSYEKKYAVNTFPVGAAERSYGFELAIETNQKLMGSDSLTVGEQAYGRH